MKLDFQFLADRPEDVPQVIRWWHSKWADRMGPDIDKLTGQLRAALRRDDLPLDIVAVLDDEMIGTAVLKRHEMKEVYPQRLYWLGSVFVAPEYRGRGVASALASRVVDMARERGLPHLYLQTEHPDGGLYADLGWEPVERLWYKNTDTLLMLKRL
jgi:GNAT superfamily N-acetyltransferase